MSVATKATTQYDYLSSPTRNAPLRKGANPRGCIGFPLNTTGCIANHGI